MSVLFPLFHNTLFGRKPLCKTHPNRVGSHALLPARQRIYINYLEFFYIRDMSILFHFKCIQSFIYINKDSQGNLFYILDYNAYAWALSPVCLFAAPWTVWTVAHQAPPSMEFSRQEYLNGLPFPSLGDLPDPGIKPASPVSLPLAGEFFTSWATRKASILLFSYSDRFSFGYWGIFQLDVVSVWHLSPWFWIYFSFFGALFSLWYYMMVQAHLLG